MNRAGHKSLAELNFCSSQISNLRFEILHQFSNLRFENWYWISNLWFELQMLNFKSKIWNLASDFQIRDLKISSQVSNRRFETWQWNRLRDFTCWHLNRRHVCCEVRAFITIVCDLRSAENFTKSFLAPERFSWSTSRIFSWITYRPSRTFAFKWF